MSDNNLVSISRSQLIAATVLLVVALAGVGLYALLDPDYREARITDDRIMICATENCPYEVRRISNRYREGSRRFHEAINRLRRSGAITSLSRGPITVLEKVEGTAGLYRIQRDGEVYWIAESQFEFVEPSTW